MATKRTSQKRFEQLNHLMDTVFPSLPSNAGAHRCLLAFAFRHAGPSGGFCIDNQRVAKAIGRDRRTVRRCLRDLEAWKLIVACPENNVRRVKAYKITYLPYQAG